MEKNSKVQTYLEQYGLADRVRSFDESTATVAEAAAALGCEPGRIAKTLAFRAADGGAVLIVTAGDARVDNRKFRELFSVKPRMLTPDETEALTGFAPGGVCPFGASEGVRIVLDNSLRRYETVFPACGTSNSAIEITPDDLSAILPAAEWVDVSRDCQISPVC